MSKKKTKELIICIVTVAILILTIVTDVFAINDIAQELGNKNTNSGYDQIEDEDKGNNTNANNTPKNNTSNNTNLNKNNMNTNKNNANTIPNTGVDYSVVFIIVICGISAVYAYKKIKDYNNF